MTTSPVVRAAVQVSRADAAHAGEVLTPEALDFVAQLHRNFNPERLRLLRDRAARQARLDAGELPDFKPNPIESEDPDWRVAPAPPDFDDRRVEITGPAEPKMKINALNSGASVFMADFEDSLSPTWDNVVTADRYAAIRGTELANLRSSLPDLPWTDAVSVLDDLIVSDDMRCSW